MSEVLTQITALARAEQLERVVWRDSRTGNSETHNIGYVFSMTGAVPNAQWLAGCVALDDQGFIKTGPDLSADDLSAAHWPLARNPYLLETSLPGVFAVGDVRGSNIKRVAQQLARDRLRYRLYIRC